MSNPTKIYNDYVRANLPSTMTFDSTTVRYDINNHSFFKFKKSNWYFKYITKFGYASLSAYAVNNFDPDLVFDFKQNYYRTGGTETTLSPAVTHARAGQATMVDSDGLLKWAPHNLLTYSSDFTNSSYSKVNVTIGSDNIVAPDGTTTADTVTATGSSYIQATLNSANTSIGYTLSVWMKVPSGTTSVDMGNIDAGVYITKTVTTDWQLFSVTQTPSATTRYPRVFRKTSGDVTVHIWGAHLYRSDLGGMVNNPAQPTGLETYVPTTSSAVYLPRVGHHSYNGSAWVNEGVLYESEARTNLAYPSDISGGSWTGGIWSNTTRADWNGIPNGAVRINTSATSTTNRVYNPSFATSGVGTHCLSFYYKSGSTVPFLHVRYNTPSSIIGVCINTSNDALTAGYYDGSIATNAFLTQGVVDVGGGWRRFYGTTSETNSSSDPYALLLYLSTSATTTTTSFGSIKSVDIAGVQMEVGSTPSSYIPTSASTVTRAAETLTVPAANLPYSSTNMSIQIDGKMTYADNSQIAEVQFWRWVLNTQNYMEARLRTASTRTGEFQVVQESLNVQDFVTGPTNTYSEGTLVPYNIATRHGSTFLNGAIQGTALTANTTPVSLPDLSATNLSLAPTYMGTIGKFRVWNEDLTDTGITEAST